MEKRVLTVLRSGGEYEPKHVQVMQRQIAKWAPDASFACLSDVEIPGVETIPLLHDWPGWYAKIELFRLEGGFLYTDLDNVIVGPIDDMFLGEYTTQRKGWNALMYVPRGMPSAIYEDFRRDQDRGPFQTLRRKFASAPEFVPFGDAGYVNQYVRGAAWEDVLPGQVVNIVDLIVRWPYTHIGCDMTTYPYKQPAPGTRVVLCANKRRRPWKLGLFKHLYEIEEKS